MLKLYVNGECQILGEQLSLEKFVQQYQNPQNQPSAHLEEQNIAIAINGEFVPRSRYSTAILNNNDCIDIVTPVGGG